MNIAQNALKLVRTAFKDGIALPRPNQSTSDGQGLYNIEALLGSPLFDWEAYLLNNPDVTAMGLRGLTHFLRFGIFEGRKLYLDPSFILADYAGDFRNYAVGAFKNGITLPRPNQSTSDSQGLYNIEALLGSPLFDWEAYLLNNPDVTAMGLRGLTHFLRFGIFEGRKLYLDPSFILADYAGDFRDYAVSVIIPNYNHGFYLWYGIESLLAQSLKNIEIIVVDDCSDDNSITVLKNFAARDKRIKIISLEHRESQHMARKKGVLEARGRYIMFMDADDYLAPEACKIAYEAISQGYDVTGFNASLLHAPNIDSDRLYQYKEYINRGPTECWQGAEILEMAFGRGLVSDLLWNKIYESGLCKAAFMAMKDGFYDKGEDIYETLCLLANAHKFCKIPDHLYTYRINDDDDKKPAASVWGPVRDFLETSGLNNILEQLEKRFLEEAVSSWLKLKSNSEISSNFSLLAKQFGITELIAFIAAKYFKDWSVVANVFSHYLPVYEKKVIKRIGILYGEFANGGTEQIILRLIHTLVMQGYEVTLFLERSNSKDSNIGTDINVIYIPLQWYGNKETQDHIKAMHNALLRQPVDLMICEACWDEALLWQTMLLKLMDIPVIMHDHLAFFERHLAPNIEYDAKSHVDVLRCADKVICLSRYAQLYYQTVGINAQYIANPVPITDCTKKERKEFESDIIIFGRLDDPQKRVKDALMALGEIKREIPDVQAIFIGSLKNTKARKNFFTMAHELNISNNIRVTGWTEKPLQYVRHTKVMISTAYQESFGLAVCESQSQGVPCVMYRIPIMPAENNPAIIQVEHGDYKGIARETVALLRNCGLRRNLGLIAKEAAHRFSPKKFNVEIKALLSNFLSLSQLPEYSDEDYRIVIRTLGFYAAHLPPWVEN